MTTNNKKLSGGAISAIITAVLAIASFIVYSVNLGQAGYFQGASVTQMPLTWAAVACLCLAVVLGYLKTKGAAGKCVSILTGLLQVAAPVLLAYCLISLVNGRAEGLGYIYFSNADVALEVQTPENLSSATTAIASLVCYGVSMVAGMVTAFFNLKKD